MLCKRTRRLLEPLMLFVLCTFLQAQAGALERTVHNRVLVFEHDPKVKVHRPASAHYIGVDRWVLAR